MCIIEMLKVEVKLEFDLTKDIPYLASAWADEMPSVGMLEKIPSQWETELLCNDISRWLGASLESALQVIMALSCSDTHLNVNKNNMFLVHPLLKIVTYR